jgi:peptide/nickel transport system substrate-binding protein
MMIKRIIALLAVLALTASLFTGCAGKTDVQEKPGVTSAEKETKESDNTSFKLSYTQGDSLDPFKAKTQNNQILSSLVFESLFDLNENYEPTPNIATEYEFIDSKTLKVKYDTSVVFSNGTKVTNEDMLFSFRAAKKSPAYGNSLQYISYAEAEGDTLYFYLSHPNPYAVNLLTYPISSVYDDDDGFPIGSGRYCFKNSDGKPVLKVNPNSDFNPYLTTISLVNIAAADSIDNAVNIGNISYAFRDLSSSVSKRMSCAKKLVNMNNLVYIGINSMAGIGANEHIRQAISLAVDRSACVKTAYSGYAVAASSPFNPACDIAKNVKIFAGEADIATARQAVAQSKLSDKALKLTILVNKNTNRVAVATLLKSQLEAAGISAKIDKVDSKEYTRRIKNIEFDIFVGEVKLSDDMSLYPFFDKKGGVRYGIDDGMECAKLYKQFLSGDENLGKFILKFNEEMPFVPILYKKGMICYTKSMHGDMQGYYGNYFANIESWSFR